jgi:hypothetical protein
MSISQRRVQSAERGLLAATAAFGLLAAACGQTETEAAAPILAAGTASETAAAEAPAPAAMPDFTGVWQNYIPGPGAPGLLGGTALAANVPVMTPEGQAKLDAFQALVQGTDYSAGAYCVGAGMPGSMLGSGPYPMEIVQRPEQVTVIYEAHTEVRRIFVGDRAAEIDPNDVFPERNGFSIARWDGDTLVVETDHLVEQFDSRYPHSDQASIVERYTLSDEDGKKVLTAEMTMTDPLFLAEPYVTTKRWQQVAGGRLLNYECAEPQWLDAIEQLEAGGAPPLPLGAAPAQN